jgi:hypothetical protein
MVINPQEIFIKMDIHLLTNGATPAWEDHMSEDDNLLCI